MKIAAIKTMNNGVIFEGLALMVPPARINHFYCVYFPNDVIRDIALESAVDNVAVANEF